MPGVQVRRTFVKTLMSGLLGSALLAAPLAGARDFRQGPRMQGQGQQAAQAKKAPQQVRRQPEKGAEHDKRHSNRLTDQERRDLRKDVDRADREIYRR
jgi:hypothetical protein